MFTEAAPCPRRKLKHQYASSIVRYNFTMIWDWQWLLCHFEKIYEFENRRKRAYLSGSKDMHYNMDVDNANKEMNLVIMIFGLCQHISAITNLHIKSFSYFLKKHIWKISITNLLFQDIFWIEDVVAYEKELKFQICCIVLGNFRWHHVHWCLEFCTLNVYVSWTHPTEKECHHPIYTLFHW